MKRTILVGVMVLGTSICSQSFGFDLLDRMLGLKGSGCDSICCDTAAGGFGGHFGGNHGGCLEPACGLEDPCGGCGSCFAEPACGLEAPCGDACGGCLEPACGCEAAVVDCGCGADPCGPKKHRLLNKLFGGLKHGHHGCDSGCGLGLGSDCGCGSCEPACGLEVVADCGGCDTASCCGKSHGGLLKKLFGRLHHNNSDCCEIGCEAGPACTSCMGGSPVGVPTHAPTVDSDPAQEVSPMPPAPVVDPSAYLHSKRRVIQASTHYTR